jgi:RHS repeat-associated protein
MAKHRNTSCYVRNGNGQLLEQWVDPVPQRPRQPQCLGTFAYDVLGRMTSAQNPDRHLQWVFDVAGRVIEDHQDDAVLKHTYDRIGRRIATQIPDGPLLRYEFDSGAALKALFLDGVALARVHRDNYGRETQRELGPQLKTETGYDPQGRLHKQRTLKQTNNHTRTDLIVARQYKYNDLGQISRIDDSRRGSTQYHYDAIDRLTRVEGPNPETFVHDPAGNLLALGENTAGLSRGNRLNFHGDSHYQYDAQGNRIAQARGKDRQLKTSYSYDAQNQLVAITTNGKQSRYHYDPLGRRIKKENETNSTDFLWLDDVLLSETTYDNDEPQTRTYLFEPYSFKPLAFIDNQQLYYYHLDHLGTPQEISDYQGNIVWSGNYKAYGSIALAQENAIDNNLRFQGQYFDEESGLHYNRFRYYDPQVGRFINQDPIGLAGGINNYRYVPNPVGWVDPFGLACKEILGSQSEFDAKYSSRFSSKKEADAAWKVYKESSGSREELVIGRLNDTAAGAELGMRRLDNPDWTINVNDAWVQGGVDGGKPFYLGSNPTISNLRTQPYPHSPYPTTVTFRELQQLRSAGYQRVGDYMMPPAGI